MYQKEVMKLKEKGTLPTKGVWFVHNCVCTCPVQEKGFFFFLLFHFYKYDVSYKMLSHLKVHSILFNIENIVTTINYSNT